MTTLTRWDPIRELSDMRRTMDRIMDRFFDEPLSGNLAAFPQRNGNAWSLPIDVAEDADAYTIKASVPGINPEQIEITLNDNVLMIKGETSSESESKETNWHVRERRYGSFSRSVTLPTSVNADAVEATNENGVLTLRLPKTEAAKPKRIAIKSTVNGSVSAN
jgi:HSP20 family protein